MSESSSGQYSIDSLFDISKIQDQFGEINDLLISEGVNLKALMENNWNVEAFFKKQSAQDIKHLQNLKTESNLFYDEQINNIRRKSTAEQKAFDRQIKHIQQEKEASRKAYNNQIDAVKKRYNAEINALRMADQERDRARDRADIKEDIQYWEKRSGVEAAEQIAELQKKLAEKEDDWASDDKTSQLILLRDAEIERLQEMRDAIQERYQLELESVREAKTQSKDSTDINIKQLQYEKQMKCEIFDAEIQYLQRISSDSNSAAQNIINAIAQLKNQAIATISDIQRSINALSVPSSGSSYNTSAGYKTPANTGKYDKSPANTGKYDKSPANTGKYFTVKSSHTGSEVQTEGLVNVAPAEIIVNPDISRGLRRLIQRENNILSATQNYYQQQFGQSKSVQFNAPLYNVEKQEITDRADLQQVENDVVRLLGRAVSELM